MHSSTTIAPQSHSPTAPSPSHHIARPSTTLRTQAHEYGCDLINLSYGESYYQPDAGRVAQTFSDATRKWGMTVFTSAGNSGTNIFCIK